MWFGPHGSIFDPIHTVLGMDKPYPWRILTGVLGVPALFAAPDYPRQLFRSGHTLMPRQIEWP